MTTRIGVVLLGVAAVLVLSGLAHSAVLVYEPFDYTGGLFGKDGGTGFDAAAWSHNVTGDLLPVSSTHVTGKDFGTGNTIFRTAGNAVRINVTNDNDTNGISNFERGLNRQLTGSGNNLWMSYLFKSVEDESAAAGRAIITTIRNTGLPLEFLPKRNADPDANVRISQAGNPSTDLTGSRLTDTGTYLVIAKYGLGTTGDAGSVDAWVLDQSNFDAVASDGSITEAELNGLVGIHAKGSSTGDGTLSSGAGLHLTDEFAFRTAPQRPNETLQVEYDELRLADSLASAVPLVAITDRIHDKFDNGDLATGGVNGGFELVTNSAGGTGTATESGGLAMIDTNTQNWDNTGIVSINAVDPKAQGDNTTLQATWVIDSQTGVGANGGNTFFRTELLLQGDMTFRPDPYIEFDIEDSGQWRLVADSGSGPVVLHDGGGLVGGVPDGYTVTMTLNAAGWDIDAAGFTANPSASGLWPAGFSFDDLGNMVHAAAMIQHQTSNVAAFLNVDSISVTTFVPEPTTLLIWSLLAGLGIGLGWRRKR